MEDYKLKTDYLNQHLHRMWTRFSFFIAAEVSLLGFYFSLATGESSNFSPKFFIFSGMVISALWYMTGAQDKFLVECYRKAAQDAGETIASYLQMHDHTPVGKTNGIEIENGFFQWRCEQLSITR